MMRPLPSICATMAVLFALPALADAELDSLARDVDRVESVRAVKTLQASYAQYAQYGLWNEVGALFAARGSFVFDGLVTPAQTAKGPAEIAAFLRVRYGGGHEGLAADDLSTMLIDAPVANLSADGGSAEVRWQTLIFYGHGSEARIEGGVFENDYVREGGVWKIGTAHYYPQYAGPYEEGWTNWGGGDLPVVPRHFDTDTAGVPIPPATDAAPETDATLAALQTRVDTLNDEDRIRNLQSAYGYYADRKMWDDVVDLFASDGVVEIGGQGIWRGPAGVRRWLESIGSAGLTHGQLNGRVQNDVTVMISPGGNEAFARGIELGMLGEADQEKGWWEVAVFHTRFVKEGGVWKIRELRRFPLMKTDIFEGWGKSRIVDPVPAGKNAPDAPVPAADAAVPGLAMPAFLGTHPVTGKAVTAAGDAQLVATRVLTGSIAKGEPAPINLKEARRRLARSAAWDGVANISATYGYYIDDSDAAGWANTMATKGFKQTPFAGYHIGRDRLIAARVKGKGPEKQAGISYHWLMQPVVLVSEDGRSATGRFRLFQPRTGKTVGEAGDFFAAQFWGGMYHNRYVLEGGVWRIWELTLDEPYITPVAWEDGVWAKAKDPAPGTRRRFSNRVNVDIPLASLGKREEHFAGGTGEPEQWPTILPMWFTYTNPVSGRVPELHQPDCVPCAQHPELRLDRNGYQEPPDAPAANRSPAQLRRLEIGVTRAEDIRALKKLQRAYGYYADRGLWDELADLFTDDAVADYPSGIFDGNASIRAMFIQNLGQGKAGLAEGRIYNHTILQPVVDLASDGKTAVGRWRVLGMLGSFGRSAIWADSLYRFDYVKQHGEWKIKSLIAYAGSGGSYDEGWVPPKPRPPGYVDRSPVRFNLAHPADRLRNQPCEDDASVCVVPFPYPNRGGIEPPDQVSAVVAAPAPAAEWVRRAQRLADEQAVMNLQHAYGYYLDRGLWQQAADLFAPDGTREVGQAGVYVGREHIRRSLALTASQGLRDGELNDHLEFEPIVDIAADGQSAKGRIFELAFVGGGGQPARIVQNVHENEYIRRAGVWMIQSMHVYTLLVTDYDQGWAKSALPAPAPSTALPPDRPPTVRYEAYPKVYTPPLHFTDVAVSAPLPLPLPSPAAANSARISPAQLAAAERQVQRAMDYDEIENLQNAYGYYAEKALWPDVAALFADDGVLEIDDERHAGRDEILAFLKSSGPEGPVKGVLNSLLQLQLVIDVAADGQTAKLRSRVLQLTRDAQGRAMWGGGVYENELVKDGGTWKFQRFHLYRTYKVDYKGGWATPNEDEGQILPTRFVPPFHYGNPVSAR